MEDLLAVATKAMKDFIQKQKKTIFCDGLYHHYLKMNLICDAVGRAVREQYFCKRIQMRNIFCDGSCHELGQNVYRSEHITFPTDIS